MLDIDYLDKKIIAVDGKALHFDKRGNKILFFLAIITGLPLLCYLAFNLIPTIEDDLLMSIIILLTLHLANSIRIRLTDMLFNNQTDVDFIKKEISITNIFGKNWTYPIKNVDNLTFCHGLYLVDRGYRYKIILKDQKSKFVVVRYVPYKKEAEKMCVVLNSFKNFAIKEHKCKNIQMLKDLSMVSLKL